MNTKNVVIGVLVAVTLLFGYLYFGKSSPSTVVGAVSGQAHYQMESFLQGISAGARDQVSFSNTGAVTTTGTWSINGVADTYRHSTLTTGTTTICALQSPTASSSLTYAAISETTSTTTASLITIAKAANAFATTTLIGAQINFAANAPVTMVASSTISANGADAATFIFGPSQWIVFGQQGGTGTFSPVGACEAVFRATT